MKFTNIAFLFLSICLASATTSGDSLFRGCVGYVGKYKFECPSKYSKVKGGRSGGCNCMSPEFMATMVDCIIRAKGGNIKMGFNSMIDDCSLSSRSDLTVDELYSIHDNASDYWVNSKDVKNKTETHYYPIKFTNKQVDQAARSFAAGFYAKYTGQLYGGLLCAYFGVIMFAAAISNFLKKVAPKFVQKTTNNKVALFFRKKLINPALFGFKHSTPVKWGPINMSLPTRAQGWVVLGYIVMFIIFMFIKYDVYEGNPRYPSKANQLSRVISDRTGVLAVTQMPLLYILAGRNNLLLWLTGLSYDTMNLYHRWVARVTFTSVFIHSIAFSALYVNQGTYKTQLAKSSNVWGIVASVCGGLVLFFSLRHFRERIYDFFLLTHLAFVVFFTVGAWYHVTHNTYYEWIYATVAFWAFDRAFRLVRLVLTGVNAKAHVELENDVFLKIKIDYNNRIWKPYPGAYAFLYFLRPTWRIWENHPFSVYPSPVSGEENKLVFCARVRQGKTLQISNYIAKSGPQTIPVFVEGPYGHCQPLDRSESVVLIAGGIGFTGAYSYACRMLEKPNVTFIWAVQFISHFGIFREEVEHLASHGINVIVYISDETSETPIVLEKGSGSDSEISEKTSGSTTLDTRYGMADIKSIVDTSVAEAPGSIGFFVCGPPGVNDSVRKHVSNAMDQGKGRVDLYIEAFNW